MSIESELSRKQNFWQAVTWICLQKNTKSTITVRELFHIPEFMINQTFSFSHCISTLFIWYCRVCYFAWWTRVLWGHRATLFFIEMMGALEQLYLRAPKSLIWHWGNQHLCMQRQHSSLATSTLGNTPNLNIGSYTGNTMPMTVRYNITVTCTFFTYVVSLSTSIFGIFVKNAFDSLCKILQTTNIS